jgi:hypothetical protein
MEVAELELDYMQCKLKSNYRTSIYKISKFDTLPDYLSKEVYSAHKYLSFTPIFILILSTSTKRFPLGAH